MAFVSEVGLRSGFGRSTRSAARSGIKDSAAVWLDSTSTVCLWIIIFVVPLMMAGIRASGVAIFAGCSFLMAITWAIKHLIRPSQGSSFTGAIVLMFAAIALVGLQIVELSPDLLRLLSPFTGLYLDAWNSDDISLHAAGPWSTISLTPALTRTAFVVAIAYAVFFVTLLQRLRTSADIDRTLHLLAAAVIVMAFVALGQMFLGNGDFLWIIHHPFRTASWPAKGTFTNQNHFAHFLALGIGPIVWWWKASGTSEDQSIKGRVSNRGFGVSRSTDTYQKLLGGAFCLVVLAGFLSLSRGGIACLLFALTVSLVALGREWVLTAKLALPMVAFLMIAIVLFGTDALEERWNRIAEAESLEELSRGRFLLWSALLSAAPCFWPAGAGVGAHPEVYPTWLQHDPGVRFSHAESGWLQVLIETGVPGVTLAAAAFAVCCFWFIRCWKHTASVQRLRLVALGSGLTVSALHSFVDFAWYIPACLIFALILAACLCRSHQLLVSQEQHKHSKWPTRWALMVLLVVLPTAFSMSGNVIGPARAEAAWMSYRELAVAASEQQHPASTQAVDERLDLMIGHLEDCVKLDSAHGAAMSRLSNLYLRRCERNLSHSSNPMTVSEIRSTVDSSEFSSRGEILEWLKRAFGRDSIDLYRSLAMARAGLKLQPLRGQTYVSLAQVGFLAQLSSEKQTQLMDQATKLRPYSAFVLFSMGRKFAENGDIATACEWWAKAVHQDANTRRRVIEALAPLQNAGDVIARLNLGLHGTIELFQHYRATGRTADQKVAAQRFAQDFSTSDGALPAADDVQFWLAAHAVFDFAGEKKKSLQCLAMASRARPNDYDTRRKFGLTLLRAGGTSEAKKHLEWCRLRNPDDTDVSTALNTINHNIRR